MRARNPKLDVRMADEAGHASADAGSLGAPVMVETLTLLFSFIKPHFLVCNMFCMKIDNTPTWALLCYFEVTRGLIIFTGLVTRAMLYETN